MRIKTIFTALLLICAITFSFSQTKEEALRDAKLAAKGTIEADYDTVIKYTLPEVISLMGGADAAKSTLTNMFESMSNQGFKFEKSEILEASDIVNEQGQFRCTVKSYNEMTMSGQRMKSTSYLLGIYNESGKHWWFIEAKQLENPAMANQILPDFKTSLELPQDDVEMEVIKE